MRIKHSKYKNTGLIFELLVKQIAADTLDKRNSPAVEILKRFYTGKSALVKEFKLYQFILKNKAVSQSRAEAIVSTITEISRGLNQELIKSQKYNLIREIKEHYDIEEFFSIKVQNYKPLAALYCLLEAHKNTELVSPDFLVENKTTVLEHLTNREQNKKDVRDSLIEEYSKYDKDLKLLIFKILLEKFNTKYESLLPEQKNILKEFITAVDSTKKLRTLVNEEFSKIRGIIIENRGKIKDDIVLIKLDEVLNMLTPIKNTERVKDSHLVNLMQYYELVHELKVL